MAAIGRAQLERLPAMIERRRQIRQAYARWSRVSKACVCSEAPTIDEANCWLSALGDRPRDRPCGRGTAHQSAGHGEHRSSAPLEADALQPIFSDAGRLDRGVSEKLFRTGVALPSGSAHPTGADPTGLRRRHLCPRRSSILRSCRGSVPTVRGPAVADAQRRGARPVECDCSPKRIRVESHSTRARMRNVADMLTAGSTKREVIGWLVRLFAVRARPTSPRRSASLMRKAPT